MGWAMLIRPPYPRMRLKLVARITLIPISTITVRMYSIFYSVSSRVGHRHGGGAS